MKVKIEFLPFSFFRFIEIFSAIIGLIGTITGAFISRRARKIFSEKRLEMSPVSSEKPGNKPVRVQKPTNKLPIKHPQHTSILAAAMDLALFLKTSN